MKANTRIGDFTPMQYRNHVLFRLYSDRIPSTEVRYIEGTQIPNVFKVYEDGVKDYINKEDLPVTMFGIVVVPSGLARAVRWQLVRKSFGKDFPRMIIRGRPIRKNMRHCLYGRKEERHRVLSHIRDLGESSPGKDIDRVINDYKLFVRFHPGREMPDLQQKLITMRSDLKKKASGL